MSGIELFFIFAGLFSFASAMMDWNWFMEHRRTRFVTSVFGGRTGARIFYIILGLGLTVLGLLGYLRVIDLS